jgi:predicted ABC-type ATPase
MSVPELWIIAGPNGAGKTTCAKAEPISALLPNVTFFNPDDRTLAKLRAAGFQGFQDGPVDVQTRLFLESADEVFSELMQALSQGRKVGVETVLSTDKYRMLVDAVHKAGGVFGLVYVALASPAIAKERVASRVKCGGHGVPEEKIEKRWLRSLENLAWFAERATQFWVIDNSDSDPRISPPLIVFGKQGYVEYVADDAFPEMKVALSSMKRR